MCNDKYNLKIICNPDTPSTMKFRMPTTPMDRKMESFNGRCIYRILNVVRDSTEAGLDNKTLLFIYPTNMTETFCNAMIEAMSCGCYVISNNIGALKEVA